MSIEYLGGHYRWNSTVRLAVALVFGWCCWDARGKNTLIPVQEEVVSASMARIQLVFWAYNYSGS